MTSMRRHTLTCTALAVLTILGLASCNDDSDSSTDYAETTTETQSAESDHTNPPEVPAESTTTPTDTETPVEPEKTSPFTEPFDGWSWEGLSATSFGAAERNGFSDRRVAGKLAQSDEIGPGVGYTVTKANGERQNCSFGWYVEDGSGNEGDGRYFTTAAHCGEPGDSVSVFGADGTEWPVGEFVWSKLGDNDALGWDHGLIRLNDNIANVTGTPNIADVRMKTPKDHVWTTQNAPYLCKIGHTSGVTCGNFSMDINDLTAKADISVEPGDSGSSVFAVEPDGSGITPLGSVNGQWNGEEATAARIKFLVPTQNEMHVEIRS